MVDTVIEYRRPKAFLAASVIGLGLVITFVSPAVADDDPCVNVEKEPAVSHSSSVSINASTTTDIVTTPAVFAWETATMSVAGQVNVNRSKYQDSVCFLFFCHDVTRIRDNFVSPKQYPVSLELTLPSGEKAHGPSQFSEASGVPVDGTPSNQDPHEQVQLKAAIAPENASIVRLDCAADPQVCSTGSYFLTVSIASGPRAKKMTEFLGAHPMTYAQIMTESMLNANMRNSSMRVRGCIARGLLSQAEAFHGAGTGESPAERQQILQEALALSPDDIKVKGALAATYAETGQYTLARATGESTVADLEKRVAEGSKDPDDFDSLSKAYATLAEVDWREVAGVSTSGVANGIAHLRMALDRTDKRLELSSFGAGADEARRRRAGDTLRLAGMLARQGSYESIRSAADLLSKALELLPNPAPGVPVAADVVRGELVTYLPVDRTVVDRSWSEARIDLPLSTDFKLSPFEADPYGPDANLVAWRTGGTEIYNVDLVAANRHPRSPLLSIDTGCSVIESVGVGTGDAVALIRGGPSCSDASDWTLTSKGGPFDVVYEGNVKSLVLSGKDDQGTMRIAAVNDSNVRSWLVSKDGGISDAKLFPADAVRAGPDPSTLALRKDGVWTLAFATPKEGASARAAVGASTEDWHTQDLGCAVGDGKIDDVAFLSGSQALVTIGRTCGLTYTDLRRPVAQDQDKLAALLLQPKTYIKVEGGAWPPAGSKPLRLAWAVKQTDPIAATVFSDDGAHMKLLVFPNLTPPEAGIERMDLYVSDVDKAYAGDAQFRIRSVALEPRPVADDKTGRQILWPRINLAARGLMGTLTGYDLKLRRPMSRTLVRNAADLAQVRRGKSRLYALGAGGRSILSLGEGPDKSTAVSGLPDSSVAFEVDEDTGSAQVVWTTNDTVDRLDIIPLEGLPGGKCGITPSQFASGSCSAQALARGLGASSSDRIVLISQHPSAAEAWTRPTALAVQSATSIRVFPFPLGTKPEKRFPFGREVVPLALSDDPEETLFVWRNQKIVAARGGKELGEAASPSWIQYPSTRRFSAGSRLLVAGGEPFSFQLFDATGSAMIVSSCTAMCPISPDGLRTLLQKNGFDSLPWASLPTVTAATDLSTIAYAAQNGGKSKWLAMKAGGFSETLQARPGVPLLYSTGPDEDVLAIFAGKALLEQWSLQPTGKRTTDATPAAPPKVDEPNMHAAAVFMAFFEDSSDRPKASSEAELTSSADCIKGWPEGNIEIRGYASSLGAVKSNLMLSRRRADAVSRFLVGQGVPALRLQTTAEGHQSAQESGDAFSRRAEVRIKGTMKAEQQFKCKRGLASLTGIR